MNFDISRIGERLYREKNEDDDVSLEGFIKHALKIYYTSFMRKAAVIRSKVFEYPGLNNAGLSMALVPSGESPEVQNIEITGQTGDVNKVLDQMQGQLTAEYNGIKVKELPEKIKKGIEKARELPYTFDSHVLVGFMGMYFAPQPEDTLKRITLEKYRHKYSAVTTPIRVEETELDENSRKLILSADRISFQNSSHVDNDIRRNLFHEKCIIIQPEKQEYVFEYSVDFVNQGVSASIYPKLTSLYELIESDFTKLTYRGMEINDAG